VNDTYFYYYKGEKFYLQTNHSSISIVSEDEFSLDKINSEKDIPNFKVDYTNKSYTKQLVISVENIKQRNNEYISEITFSQQVTTLFAVG
jgi:hypothetical protein